MSAMLDLRLRARFAKDLATVLMDSEDEDDVADVKDEEEDQARAQVAMAC